MDALSVLQALNQRVEAALSTAAGLAPSDEDDLDDAATRVDVQRRRPHRRPKSASAGLAGLRGPDAAATASGPRVTGGRWGAAPRQLKLSDRVVDQDLVEVGPGCYDPNVSFVGKTRRAFHIAAPTARPAAAHLKAFLEEECQRSVGPGCYTPDDRALSESRGKGALVFAKPSVPSLPLLCKRFVESELQVAAPPLLLASLPTLSRYVGETCKHAARCVRCKTTALATLTRRWARAGISGPELLRRARPHPVQGRCALPA